MVMWWRMVARNLKSVTARRPGGRGGEGEWQVRAAGMRRFQPVRSPSLTGIVSHGGEGPTNLVRGMAEGVGLVMSAQLLRGRSVRRLVSMREVVGYR